MKEYTFRRQPGTNYDAPEVTQFTPGEWAGIDAWCRHQAKVNRRSARRRGFFFLRRLVAAWR